MAFTCRNEIEILGGTEAERGKAADLVLAADCVDEDSAERGGTGSRLSLRLDSQDGLPEEELASIAAQFPGLSFTLVYFSLDGEFFGYAKLGASGGAAESADFAEDTRELVGRRYDGDGLAFVRANYAIEREGE
jgi:hypothetical protein